MDKNISDKVIHRLTLYHCILRELNNEGKAFVSGPYIADLLNIDDSQVRKDMKLLGKLGKTKVGYSVSEMKRIIEITLGFKKTKDAFIIGAGNLGTALAKYDDFSYYGFNILAMFDNDDEKTGEVINNKQVFNISKLPDLRKRLGVEIAILTVPGKYAQETAEYIASAGIKYIWNFTPVILRLSKEIQVWNENLLGNFLQFTKDI